MKKGAICGSVRTNKIKELQKKSNAHKLRIGNYLRNLQKRNN